MLEMIAKTFVGGGLLRMLGKANLITVMTIEGKLSKHEPEPTISFCKDNYIIRFNRNHDN